MSIIEALKNIFRPTDLRRKPEILRRGVRASYSLAATTPNARHPFPCGRVFAQSLGYPDELLDAIPDQALE